MCEQKTIHSKQSLKGQGLFVSNKNSNMHLILKMKTCKARVTKKVVLIKVHLHNNEAGKVYKWSFTKNLIPRLSKTCLWNINAPPVPSKSKLVWEWPWPFTTDLSSNRDHLHIDVYQSSKFEIYRVNCSPAIVCISCGKWCTNRLRDQRAKQYAPPSLKGDQFTIICPSHLACIPGGWLQGDWRWGIWRQLKQKHWIYYIGTLCNKISCMF